MMPSADETWASCGCVADPRVTTSPIAEIAGTLVLYWASTFI
jgi:hypothetical protein